MTAIACWVVCKINVENVFNEIVYLNDPVIWKNPVDLSKQGIK